jgi:hypothetical protein
MRTRCVLALPIVLLGATSTALACGRDTVALIESVTAMDKPLLFNCGSEFNEMLVRAHRKDWKGALAAYEAHLTLVGKPQAGSADASRTLAFLRQKAEAQ